MRIRYERDDFLYAIYVIISARRRFISIAAIAFSRFLRRRCCRRYVLMPYAGCRWP